ncbi:LytR C-terminal domain-containing protein [Actinotignum urinale]|uniref:LytR C-terminal domain-containing protein n=1 Tax=Actinotignum urinale TaxID=190146 RepID=A0AAW9HV13_9ACTO|nr:LytR C-terminal domain-containing protein [Actinotignum urinale]MDY5128728.1 LytR C-terminal domain-containing protein [Actinotignum urinale]MDY5133048.1 LytR C-terminal domain-containing protein [Actinotignum urinale]MDY5154255.1 LytR C-terminal domain-containing protein [Actinotignum urinale]MDY5159597.1 LytR C-terminal domain-containing protein [Actinotignum urinale]WIK58436.1 LytR C-terminal domain-containing protein [Actinotignum urinale]
MAKTYPEDEFDVAARGRKNNGAHRRRKSATKWWLALLAVIVLAPTAGYGIVWFNQMNVKNSQTTSQTSKSTPSATASPTNAGKKDGESPKPSGTPTPTPTPSPTPTSEAKLDRAVLILNATSVRGVAGSVQEKLQGSGYTATSVGNYKYRRPAQSQVFYPNDEDEATAKDVAAKLGIAQVIKNAEASGDRIIVVVAQDIAGR